MEGTGGISVRVDSNTVVFDTMSDTNDVKMRNELAKHASDDSASFSVKVQGRINAVINQASLDSFKESERAQGSARPATTVSPPLKRPRVSTYASVFTAPAQQEEPTPIKFTRLYTKPLFVNPRMRFFIPRQIPTAPQGPQPIARQLMSPPKPNDAQLVVRPPSPIFRQRFSSTEIIVAGGCTFPVNDMLDMGSLLDIGSQSREEVLAVTALV